MDEQEDSSETEMEEKGLWSVITATGHLGGIQEHCQSMQGCKEKGQGPPGIESGKGCQKQQEGLLQLHQ